MTANQRPARSWQDSGHVGKGSAGEKYFLLWASSFLEVR